MEGNNQEVAPAIKKQQDVTPAVAAAKPELPVDPNLNFRSGIIRLKEGINSRVTKINLLLSPKKTPNLENQQVSQEVLSPEEAMTKSALLLSKQTDNEIPALEFLDKSQKILDESGRLIDQLLKEQKKIEHQSLSRVGHAMQNIDIKINELRRAKGFKKIRAHFEKAKLEKQKLIIQEETAKLIKQAEDKQQLRYKIDEHFIKQVSDRQRDVLSAEIAKEITGIKTDYERMLEAVLENGAIGQEMRNGHIQHFIAPKVHAIAQEKGLSEKEEEEFYSALRKSTAESRKKQDQRNVPLFVYLDSRDTRDNRQEQERFFSTEGKIFGELEDDCESLYNQGYDAAVKELIAKMAIEDLMPISEIVHSRQLFPRRPGGHGYIGFGPISSESYGDFGSRISREVTWSFSNENYRNTALEYKVKNLAAWQALKFSKIANENFGEAIKKQDNEFYKFLLNKSLDDKEGQYIEKLYYYPAPDTIKNLIALAASDESGHRMHHANNVLSRLKGLQDWKDIMDKAEVSYPLLEPIRPVLEKRKNGTENQFHIPNIQKAAEGFMQALAGSDDIDPKLARIAWKALTDESLLDLLTTKGIISDSEKKLLKDCRDFLELVSEKIRPEQKEYSEANGKDRTAKPSRELKINTYGSTLRDSLLYSLRSDPKTPSNQELLNPSEVLKRLEKLSQEILNFQKSFQETPSDFASYQALNYLVSERTIQKLLSPSISSENISVFIKAYENYPSLTAGGNDDLLRALCKYFKGKETIQLFRDISSDKIFIPEKSLDLEQGEAIKILKEKDIKNYESFIEWVSILEMEKTGRLLLGRLVEINELNWQKLLVAYVGINAPRMLYLTRSSPVLLKNINSIFNEPKNRDFCLNKFQNMWQAHLKENLPGQMPFSLSVIPDFINYCGGAGPLSQIESLSNFIVSVNKAFSKETTVQRTKNEIHQGLREMEGRFANERLSNEDKTDFYNISRDVLDATPSIFSDYLNLFKKLTPSQMRLFAKEMYPLYRAKLVFMEKKDEQGNTTYDRQELVQLRESVRSFSSILNGDEKSFASQKEKLILEIKNLFKERLGIIKTPDNFSPEQMRSFTNVSTYLANLNERTPEKETVLGFYLSLTINNQWDDFRKGKEINPDEYLIPEKSNTIKNILAQRQKLNPLTSDNLGVSNEDLPELQRLLQQETQNVVIGDIETIDVKLNNIILNLHNLEDLDLYPDPMDKERMRLLLMWGNKKVGSAIAKLYQQMTNPAKKIDISEDENEIQKQIPQIIKTGRLTLDQKILKEHFQDRLRPLATVTNLLGFVKETQAEAEIESLREMLKPSQNVIEIFNRLGEDFKPTSGAMALSQDLNYLDNLIVKREDELKPEEKTVLLEYTAKIRGKVVKLENIYAQIKNKFSNLKQGSTNSSNQLFVEKLSQIEKIINTQNTQQVITSTVTNDLNVIIENVRECLSCTRNGGNNDTNLTFGDVNKFYLCSQSETQRKGSISDQLVFVEPIVKKDGSKEMSFVLDRIYGTQTPVILENQIETVLKKQRIIKQRFPNIKLSVFVSDTTVATGGLSADMLLERSKSKNMKATKETAEIDVIESAMADHYIEFGGSARQPGKRQVNGILIST